MMAHAMVPAANDGAPKPPGPAADPLSAVRGLLARYQPAEADRRAQREEVLAFLDAHPDALDRACRAGHLTGSAAVVDAGRRRVLLVLHPRFRRWLQPGGHADGDPDLAAVALREAREETGISGLTVATTPVDVDVHHGDPDGSHLHLDIRFVVQAPPGNEHPVSDEGAPLRWVAPEELAAAGVDDRTARFLRAALRPGAEYLPPEAPG